MRRFFICLLFIGICSITQAAWHVNVDVTSNPSGCPIEVNGISMGVTPGRLQLNVAKIWVGLINSPDGWAYGKQSYRITCLPPAGGRGLVSQTKMIMPGQSPKGAKMHFDLSLTPVMPTQSIRIETPEKDPAERLRKLKGLLDEGLIDKEDYDRQRKKILSDL